MREEISLELIVKSRGKIIFSFILGFAVVVVGAIIGDVNKMAAVLNKFEWWILVPVLGLVTFNYGLRFFRWQYYLKVVGNGADKISTGDSAIIFFSNLSMSMTPGKAGELLKSYLLNRVNGTPMMVSAPIVMAERVMDGLAMLILSSIGLFLFNEGWLQLILLATLLGSIAIFVVIQWRWLALKLINLFAKIPFLTSRMHHLHNFYQSTYLLFRPRATLIGVGLAVAGWFMECIAFFLLMLGLGFPPDFPLLLQCTSILAIATLAGLLSLLPGGLGAAEASIGGLLKLAIPNITTAMATTATLLIRFCTLWYGVIVGLIILFSFQTKFSRPTGSKEQGSGSRGRGSESREQESGVGH
jgi:glycosyltransferase 2 family protein